MYLLIFPVGCIFDWKGKDGKGKGNKGIIQAQLKDALSPAHSTAKQNLATKHSNKTLCLRFNRGQCTNAKRKYAHLCAIKLPNGQVCGQKHAAHTHRFKSATPTEQSNASAAPVSPGT